MPNLAPLEVEGLPLDASCPERVDDKSEENEVPVFLLRYWLAKFITRVVDRIFSRSDEVACMRAPLVERTFPKVCVLLRTWDTRCGGEWECL